MHSDLKATVIEMLANRPHYMSLTTIEAATGIPSRWIGKIANDRIEDPSVVRIEILYRYLSGKTLDL